jgi:hypothetical protein
MLSLLHKPSVSRKSSIGKFTPNLLAQPRYRVKDGGVNRPAEVLYEDTVHDLKELACRVSFLQTMCYADECEDRSHGRCGHCDVSYCYACMPDHYCNAFEGMPISLC